MIGLFGVSEALVQIHDLHIKPIKQDVRKIIPSWRLLFKHLPLIIKSGAHRIWIGALPGAGGTSLLSCPMICKKKHQETFKAFWSRSL